MCISIRLCQPFAIALAIMSLVWGASAAATTPRATAPRIVVSIAPLHSLVAGVAGKRAAPYLLVPPGQSPHTFALAPSDARALAGADVVFAASPVGERFLKRPLAALAGDARMVWMARLDAVHRLPARSGGVWKTHHEHDQHAHGNHDDERTESPSGRTSIDPHVWLDPDNAIAFTRAVADILATIDPAHAKGYHARATEQVKRLRALDARLRERLAPVADVPYLVFHDAYQYFGAHYGLSAVGAITVHPGRSPGARRLYELRQRIERSGVRCLFTEPQFESRIARVLVAETDARLATLDPLGAHLAPGPGLYGALLRDMAAALRGCLGE